MLIKHSFLTIYVPCTYLTLYSTGLMQSFGISLTPLDLYVKQDLCIWVTCHFLAPLKLVIIESTTFPRRLFRSNFVVSDKCLAKLCSGAWRADKPPRAWVLAEANAMWPTEKQDHRSEHKLRAASWREEAVSNPKNRDVTQNSGVWVGGGSICRKHTKIMMEEYT